MNNIFCIISAIGNDYGIFSYQERLNQLKNTIKSVHTYAPGSDILLIEASENILPEADINLLHLGVNKIIFLNNDKYIKFLKYNSKDPTPNKYEKKTVGEIQSCIAFLEYIKQHPNKYNRIFKLGGRLALNANFNLKIYEEDNRLILLDKEKWYDELIFPMRLWSFGYDYLDQFISLFRDIQTHTYDTVTNTKKLELIEFTFTKFVESYKIPYHIVDKVGVEGLSGLNASVINE